MEKIVIEVLDETAMNELRKMEDEQKIHIVEDRKTELNKEERRKIVESLRGSISQSSYESMMKELKEMREGWERNI